MENIIKLYEINILIIKLINITRKIFRIFFVITFVTCLYINCVCGVRLLHKESVNEYNTQEEKVSIEDNNVKNEFYNILQKLPSKNPSFDYAGRVTFPKVLREKHLEKKEVNVDNSVIITNDENTKNTEDTESLPHYPMLIVHGNGGIPKMTEIQLDTDAINVDSLVKPQRLGKQFDKWYADLECTIPFTDISDKAKPINIYAGWKEFRGFISDDDGLITGYTDPQYITFSGELVFPSHESCIGVQEGALSGLEDLVEGVYIPKNIVDLPEGVFDKFLYLMFIQVENGNPLYKSVNGVLYTIDGVLVCKPQGQISQ